MKADPQVNQSDVTRLWEKQWATATPDVAAILQDRFTVEAYRRLSPFVTRPDAAVLEAGCGTGRFSALLGRQHPRARVIAIDVSASAVAMARRVSRAIECRNVSFEQASVFALPFPDNHFDLVFNEGVLPLFGLESDPSYRDVVREMARVTKPGGKLLVSVANWNCFPHTLYKWYLRQSGQFYEYGYEKSFKRSELRRVLTEYGLKNLEFSGFYPAYGFYRHAGRGGTFRAALRLLGLFTDRLDRPWLSRTFGFQVMVAGTK